MTPDSGVAIRWAGLVTAAFVIQVAFLNQISILGVHPELMLLVAIGAGLVVGPHRGAGIGFAAGLLVDLTLHGNLGVSAFCYTLVGFLVGYDQGSDSRDLKAAVGTDRRRIERHRDRALRGSLPVAGRAHILRPQISHDHRYGRALERSACTACAEPVQAHRRFPRDPLMALDTDSTHIRLSAVGVVALSLFLTLFMRLWFLQGIDRKQFEAVSQSNRLRVIHEEAPRGRILDRNGKVIVDNKTSVVVSLDREPLRKMKESERDRLFVKLADTLNSLSVPVKVSLIQKRFNDTRYAPQDSVPIAENVDDSVEIYLMERTDEFPGVLVERKAIRTYPYGALAVHVLGYVGQINDTELAERGVTSASLSTSGVDSTTTTTSEADDDVEKRSDYRPGDSIGKSGVEQAYEDDLRGVPGQRTIEVNARGDLVDVVKVDPPKQGNDVWLSIDIDLQAQAERLLESRVLSLRGRRDESGNRLNAPQGSVVVQDPRNGEIRAMASFPDYDPATLVNGISQEQWEAFNDPNSGMPLVNWAIGGTYAPGSTFKLFSAYAGLSTGYLTRRQRRRHRQRRLQDREL
ncbi:MAG: rod shape-determining protein MreD [Microthrixaceae bacterium]